MSTLRNDTEHVECSPLKIIRQTSTDEPQSQTWPIFPNQDEAHKSSKNGVVESTSSWTEAGLSLMGHSKHYEREHCKMQQIRISTKCVRPNHN